MKILLIRFSSFGDVLQTLSVAGSLKAHWPSCEIHWVTRAEFEPLIETHPAVNRVWCLKKGSSLADLWKLSGELRAQKFTHVYDAHNSLRSRVMGWRLKGFFNWRVGVGQIRFLRRPIYRYKRFLLFRFRKNLFPRPFSGQRALLEPLQAWGLDPSAPPVPQLFLPEKSRSQVLAKLPHGWDEFVSLAPSAAFELKRWPLEYWVELVKSESTTKFAILGGPEDQFVESIVRAAPERVVNLAGRLSLEESAQIVSLSKALVANDTGLMHVAEQMGRPCIALMGPAPFGFPSRPLTRILELDLSCRPCSKHGQGPCVNSEFQKCLRDIKPSLVKSALDQVIDV